VHIGPVAPAAQAPRPPGAERDGWEGLKTLIRARLLVATLALPIGVLLRPDAEERAWWVLWWSLLVVGVASALFWLGTGIRRGRVVQTYGQIGFDVVMVAVLAALTGGRDSQFVLFFGLVVVSGGLLGRLAGGLAAAAGACAGFVLLPWLSGALGSEAAFDLAAGVPAGLLVAFLATVGVLSGLLGERVRRTREDLHRTTRELDRVRVDNDTILRHLMTGVLTVDADGTVAYLNPAAEQVLGVSLAGAHGRAVGEALPARLDALRTLVQETLETRAPRSRAEIHVHNPQGRALPLGVSANPLTHEDDVTGVVAVFSDLTEVREMERRVRRSKTLAEVGALAAGIAHELRNGLNPISGSVECLQRELRLEGENAILMDLISKECGRLNRFVTDLLAYSRERDLALETCGLDEMLADACELLRRDARWASRGVALRYARGDAAVTVRADREQLRQVWLNLATNALDAMEQGGSLTVRWTSADEDHVAVEFADTGAGITAEDLPRIGQPFFTTKKGGTGLGLAIAQRIVERHGGSLAFDSVPGRGTTVRVVLPCAVPAMAQAA
jgi:two-component system sensor histidine kinase PilS (NtrC family)